MSDLLLKVGKSEHERMVKHAIDLVKKRQDAKWEICKIAIKICYIQDKKGGRLPENAYSITNFAEDIGINRKTLSCWILDYQGVYSRIDIDDNDLKYSEKLKLNKAISKTRTELYNLNEMSREDIKKIPSEEVFKAVQKNLELDPVVERLISFQKNLSHHIYTLKNEKFNTKDRKKELAKYIEVLSELWEATKEYDY